MKDVAVVILNWNGRKWLEKFLQNVVDNSPEADVIVADNGSSDDSLAYLQEAFPMVQRIALDQNYGFCGGYNRALAQLSHPYFLLLNSDIEVTEGWLTPLLHTIQSSDNIAIVQPKILDYAQRDTFEYAGAAGGFIDHFGFPFCRGRVFESLEKDLGQYNTIMPVTWASGAAMFVKSSVWRQLGGLDELFFAHMEEIDFCWRAHNHGYQVMVNPASTVYHVGGGTLPKKNPRKTFLNFRNGLFLLYKNLPKGKRFSTLFIRMILDGIAAVYFLVTGHPNGFWQVIKAHLAFYSQLSQLTIQPNGSLPGGTLQKSIVAAHFLKGKKKYTDL